MIKRFTAIFLILALSVTLFSCDRGNNKPEETEGYILPTEIIDADISFPYMSSDSFEPYAAKSVTNRNLIPIIYESLFVPTEDGKGEKLLARESTVNGKDVIVKLLEGVRFSDGVEVNSAYVKASFELAKKNDYYEASLKDVISIKAVDNLTVKFTFSRETPFMLNVLSFPVVRKSKGAYIGCGKYKIDYLENAPYLQANTYHRDYSDSWNKQLALYDMAGVSSPIYPFKANKISVYKHELSTESYVNLSSQTIAENMNNLVYVGVNSKWAGSVTSIDWVRQAINIGLDRNSVGAASFLGQTSAVVTPFKKDFYQLSYENLPQLSGETERAIAILERNGYDKINQDGIRTNGSNALKVNILVCTENEYKKNVAEAVKKSLEVLGFGVSITEKATLEDFSAALSQGHFGLYIGETRLSYDYNLDEFFSKGGQLSYGIDEAFFAEYEAYKSGADSTMTFVEGFETEVPFIPLFYRKAVVSVNPNISGVSENSVYSSVSDWRLDK